MRKKRGQYHVGEGHVDTGFSLKQCQKFFKIKPAVRKKSSCIECQRSFEGWYQGNKRLEWFCEKCRRQL